MDEILRPKDVPPETSTCDPKCSDSECLSRAQEQATDPPPEIRTSSQTCPDLQNGDNIYAGPQAMSDTSSALTNAGQGAHKNIPVEKTGNIPRKPTRKKKVTYECSVCGRTCRDKCNYLRHVRIHTEERSLMCIECGKSFTQSSQLVRHQRTHTGEKAYMCSECGKAFSQNFQLAAHRRTHNVEKPHVCMECGKCFNWASKLAAHQKIHSGKKPFLCKECGKSFSRKEHLIRHCKLHTGEKPYACSECGKCFSRKEHLIRHHRAKTAECIGFKKKALHQVTNKVKKAQNAVRHEANSLGNGKEIVQGM